MNCVNVRRVVVFYKNKKCVISCVNNKIVLVWVGCISAHPFSTGSCKNGVCTRTAMSMPVSLAARSHSHYVVINTHRRTLKGRIDISCITRRCNCRLRGAKKHVQASQNIRSSPQKKKRSSPQKKIRSGLPEIRSNPQCIRSSPQKLPSSLPKNTFKPAKKYVQAR